MISESPGEASPVSLCSQTVRSPVSCQGRLCVHG